MRKLLFALILAIAQSASADPVCYATMAQFLAGRCGSPPGSIAWIVDPTSASDCSVGGGESTQHYCVRTPDGTGAVFGVGTGLVSNGIANESGLARLQQATDILAPPAQSRTRVYISAAGNDASDGRTEATAWKTWDKVGDEWEAIGCGLEVVTLPAGGAWDTDAEWGTGCATGSANCGISGSGTAANCADPNAISLWIHSKDNSIAVLNASSLTSQPGGTTGGLGIFETRPTSDKGWVVIEDMTVVGFPSGTKEAYHAGIFGKMVVLNSPNNSVSPGSTSQVFSATEPAGSAQMVVLGNVSATNAGTGGRIAFASQDNRLTLISNGGVFNISSTANSAMFEVNTRAKMSAIGVTAIGGSATPQGFFSNPSSGLSELIVARSVFDGSANAAASGLDVRTNLDNEQATILAYQITLTNGHATATGKLLTNEAAPTNTTRIPMIECWDCILGAYAGAGANPSLEIFGAASSTPFRGRLIVDEGASSAPYRLNSTNYTTFALLQAAAAGAWPQLTITDDNASVQWGTNNNYGCLLANTCSKSTSSNYTVQLAASIPAFVLGESVSAVRLNEAIRNYGAR